MHKARKKISEAMPEVDLVIEVLDARIPYASTNPLVDDLRSDKPCIKELNKADLADPKQTQASVTYAEQQHNNKASPLVAEESGQTKQLITLTKQRANERSSNKLSTRV